MRPCEEYCRDHVRGNIALLRVQKHLAIQNKRIWRPLLRGAERSSASVMRSFADSSSSASSSASLASACPRKALPQASLLSACSTPSSLPLLRAAVLFIRVSACAVDGMRWRRSLGSSRRAVDCFLLGILDRVPMMVLERARLLEVPGLLIEAQMEAGEVGLEGGDEGSEMDAVAWTLRCVPRPEFSDSVAVREAAHA